jgi:hypothetical protein
MAINSQMCQNHSVLKTRFKLKYRREGDGESGKGLKDFVIIMN